MQTSVNTATEHDKIWYQFLLAFSLRLTRPNGLDWIHSSFFAKFRYEISS